MLESSNKAAQTTVMILFDAFDWAIYPLSQLCRKEGKHVNSTGVSTLRLLIAEWLWDNYSRCLMSTRWLFESSLCCCSLHVSIWWWRRLPSNDEVTVSDQSSISHRKTREQSDMGLVGGWLCWELSSLQTSALQTLCAFAKSWQPVMRKRRVTGFPPKCALANRSRTTFPSSPWSPLAHHLCSQLCTFRRGMGDSSVPWY